MTQVIRPRAVDNSAGRVHPAVFHLLLSPLLEEVGTGSHPPREGLHLAAAPAALPREDPHKRDVRRRQRHHRRVAALSGACALKLGQMISGNYRFTFCERNYVRVVTRMHFPWGMF